MDWVHLYSAFSAAVLSQGIAVTAAQKEGSDRWSFALAAVMLLLIPYLRAMGVI